MGVLPVPEEVKEIGRRIDQALELLKAQNNLLQQIVPELTKSRTDTKWASLVNTKLEDIGNSLVIIKDAVRFK